MISSQLGQPPRRNSGGVRMMEQRRQARSWRLRAEGRAGVEEDMANDERSNSPKARLPATFFSPSISSVLPNKQRSTRVPNWIY